MSLSQFALNRQPDPPLDIPPGYSMTRQDRRLIDDQIIGVQTELARSLSNGQIATWVLSDPTQAALVPGDCVTTSGGSDTVRLATTANLAATGAILGMVIVGGPAGTAVAICSLGAIPSGVSGLAKVAGLARVSAVGRAERVASYGTGDIPLGPINALGTLTIAASHALTAGGGGSAIDGDLVVVDYVPTGFTPTITGTAATATNQLAAIIAGANNAILDLNRFYPERYLPAGTTPAMVDASGAWHVYINAALAATGCCLLSNKVYNVTGTVTVLNNSRLAGLGPLSGLKSVAGMSTSMVIGYNVNNWVLENVTFDGSNLLANTDLVNIAFTRRGFVNRCVFKDWSTAANTLQGCAGLRITGNFEEVDVTWCYAEHLGAAPTLLSLDAIVLASVQTSHVPRRSRVVHNRVNGTNIKNCIYVDGWSMSAFEIAHNQTWDGSVTGVLFGYYGVSTGLNSIVAFNHAYNMSGSGVYVQGNDGIPTPDQWNEGVIVHGNICDYCGGGVSGSTGPASYALYVLNEFASVTGNIVRNPGRNPNGTNKVLVATSVGIGLGQPLCRFTGLLQGNEVYNAETGYHLDGVVQVLIANNIALGSNVRGMQIAVQSSGKAELDFHGNSIDGNVAGAGEALLVVCNQDTASWFGFRDNVFRTGRVHIQNAKNGEYVGNTVIGAPAEAVRITANMSNALNAGSRTFFIHDNTAINCNLGMQVDSATGHTVWKLIGPTRCVNTPNTFGEGGPVTGLTHECLDMDRKVVILSDTTPTAAEFPNVPYGTEIRRQTSTTGQVYGYFCSVAGSGGGGGTAGTFKTLTHNP